MSHRIATALVAFLLPLLLAAVRPAAALTAAVLPVDDLSSTFSTVSAATTDLLSRELARHGVQVVPKEAVAAFLTSRRIRQLGAIQSQDVVAARAEMQADMVVLASLCQQNEQNAALGLTVSLIRVVDAKTIWSSSRGASLLDEQRLLGLDAPSSMADLQAILIRELFATWPQDLEKTMSEGIVAASGSDLEVDSVFFTPKYVQPGQEVTCTVRFKVRKDDDRAKVFIRVGSRVHVATSVDGRAYRVSWVGSDDKNGTPLKVAMIDPDSQIINGIWTGAPRDAEYPISLILELSNGKREETYVGSYVVDSQPPDLIFKILNRKTVQGTTVFRSELPLAVLFTRAEPISRWEFTVHDAAGALVLSDKGTGQPPDDIVWRGQNNKGIRVEPGLYRLNLKAWDLAQNLGQASEAVQLLAPAPGLNVALEDNRQGLTARLTPVDGAAVVYWRMELWSADNLRLGSFEGRDLPANFSLPELGAARRKGKVGCLLVVRDALGSQASRKVPDLLSLAEISETKAQPEPAAKPETKDQDSWQVDF